MPAVDEGLGGRPALHAAALVRPVVVIAVEILIERGLHFRDAFEPCAPAFDAEVFVQQRSVEPLYSAVRLRPAHLGCPMFDLLQLQEEFVGVMVGSTAELAPVVEQDDVDRRLVILEEGQHFDVHQMHRRDRRLVRIKPRESVARMAVDGALQIDLADTLQHADEDLLHKQPPWRPRPMVGRGPVLFRILR